MLTNKPAYMASVVHVGSDIANQVRKKIMGFQLTNFDQFQLKWKNQFCSFLRNYKIGPSHSDFDQIITKLF